MTVIHIPSIHCHTCEQYLRSLLTPLPIRNLSIDLQKRSLSFSALNDTPSEEALILGHVQDLLGDAGYEVERSHHHEDTWLRWLRERFDPRERRRRARHLSHCSICRGKEKMKSTSSSTSEKGKEREQLESIHVINIEPTLQRSRFSIEGMTCTSCTSTITSHLRSLSSVAKVSVNLTMNSAEVIHDASALTAKDIQEQIEDLGYGAEIIDSEPLPKLKRQAVFGIEGMTCTSCVNSVELSVNALPSVEAVSVSLMQNTLKLIYDPLSLSKSEIIQAVSDLGFEAMEWEDREMEEKQVDQSTRTVIIEIDGVASSEHATILNDHFKTIPVLSYTPLTPDIPRTTITYVPSRIFTIRHLLSLPAPFSAHIYNPPTLISRSRELQAREAKKLTFLFVIATLFAIPTFVIGVIGMTVLPAHNRFRMWCDTSIWGNASRSVVALWVLATFVQFGVGSVFYERSFKSVRSSSSRKWKWSNLVHFGNMDLLVSLSTSVAYVTSIAMMAIEVRGGNLAGGGTMTYFDSCVFLIFFILMGRVLEGRVRVKTGDAISGLGQMRPESALLISHEEGLEKLEGGLGSLDTTTIPVDQLELGDRILIRPGSIPPADGTVLYGNTTVDESSLTGESLPVSKQSGDSLLSGTTNLTSAVVMRVDNLGESTMLQKIVQAVAEAQSRKAPIERLADRITSVFVPVIVWLSVVVLIVWLGVTLSGVVPNSDIGSGQASRGSRVFFAFEFAIATLVVACPCGIGLAAPTAQAVGSGMAARSGILAQGGGEAFQLASAVDTVVFDKTGTLTTGDTIVVDSLVTEDSPKWLLDAVKALEQGSSHPLAAAIVNYLADSQSSSLLQVLKSTEVPGKGVSGVVQYEKDEFNVLIGNEGFVRVDNEAEGYDAQVDEWKSAGKSVVLVGVSSSSTSSFKIVASLAISDTPRAEAARTVAALKRDGKQVWMLSGDNPVTAKAVGVSVGIDADNIVAGVLPHEKSAFIRELRERSSTRKVWWKGEAVTKKSVVAFCGDGLNDTAALETADVGFALSHGSQITISAASFVLLSTSSPLSSLPDLLHLSAKVYMRQKMNFTWAMVYNVILLPLAAGVFYAAGKTRLPPVWSALAMALSSVSVVTSSLALKWGW